MRIVDKSATRSPRLVRLILAGVLLLAVLGAAGVFNVGRLREIYYAPRLHLVDIPRTYFQARLNAPAAPLLDIDMKYRHYERVAARREEALQFGLLVGREDDWVPATIRLDDTAVDVRMRLKGDLVDHLSGDKWSFRINVRGEGSLFGMRRFSLQHPATRRYLSEWAFHKALRRDGLLTPRYQFVRVRFNGDDKGLYALEEHMAKELLESQGRREGPIVKFDETVFWNQRANAMREGVHWSTMDHTNFRTAPVTFFQEQKLRENPVMSSLADAAFAKLDAFRQGRLPASQVFDVPSSAAYLARTKVWGGGHALLFFNLRWYYNPVTTLLEPIAYDAAPWEWSKADMWATRLFGSGDPKWADPNEHDLWLHLLLQDEPFLRRYARELHVVSRRAYVDSLTADLSAELSENLNLLHTEWPRLTNPLVALDRGRGFIAGVLNPPEPLLARLTPGSLQLANNCEVPVEVLGYRVAGRHVELPDPLLLREHAFAGPARWALLPINSTGVDSSGVTVDFRVVGSDAPRQMRAIDAPQNVETVPPALMPTAAEALARFAFLDWQKEENVLVVRPGTWTVEGDLSLPPGVGLRAGPGTTLKMQSGAVIVVRGPLQLLGSEDAPVVLESAGDTWAGLVLLESPQASRWSHVRVTNTASISRPGWTLPGGVTFYQSAVTLEDCVFSGHRGEDALNIMSGPFHMARCLFRGAPSDAFDGDFVTGDIVDCSFVDIGGDAVDVSGSRIEVTDVRTKRVLDKSISAGEESHVRVRNLQVEDGGMGVASKDLSVVDLQGGYARGLKIGLAAYTKKTTYGPARITAEGFSMTEVKEPVLVQAGSLVTLDQVRHEGSDLDVDALYQAGVLGN